MGDSISSYYADLRETEAYRKQKLLEEVEGDKWIKDHDFFFGIAEVARLKSKDKHTKIGAVIVGPEKEIVSIGYNSLPRGVDDLVPERYERPEKYNWMEHAERNAIYTAARSGFSTNVCEMYMTCDLSCIDCARAIAQSGIYKIHITIGGGAKGQYYLDQMKVSKEILTDAGVQVVKYSLQEDGTRKRVRC